MNDKILIKIPNVKHQRVLLMGATISYLNEEGKYVTVSQRTHMIDKSDECLKENKEKPVLEKD